MYSISKIQNKTNLAKSQDFGLNDLAQTKIKCNQLSALHMGVQLSAEKLTYHSVRYEFF